MLTMRHPNLLARALVFACLAGLPYRGASEPHDVHTSAVPTTAGAEGQDATNTAEAIPPAGGDGLTPATAFQISELGHLVWMSETVGESEGRYYRLMNDIDASETATWNDAGTTEATLEGYMPIGTYYDPFTGVLNGNGHVISGLTVNRPDGPRAGLFGIIESGAVVRDLGMEGGVAVGNMTGGLVGWNKGAIENCYATGAATGYGDAGGLVGWNGGSITNCYATGDAIGSAAGGLVGQNSGGTITNCYATGTAMGRTAGGLVGLIYHGGTITNCYAVGVVAGIQHGGGLIGVNYDGAIANCYWDFESSGLTISDGGTGKSTARMKQKDVYQGWDFTTAWGILEDLSYPYLKALESDPPVFRVDVAIKGRGRVVRCVQGVHDDGPYAPGAVVTLVAIPADASIVFDGWSGPIAHPTAASTTVVMDSHKSVRTRFRKKYEIRTLADLQAIAFGDLDGRYTLMNDIDASETATWNDAGTSVDALEGFMPIGVYDAPFTGVFEGNGHSIRGLTVDRPLTDSRPDSWTAGLFGIVGWEALIRDLALEGGAAVGHIAGRLAAQNCGTITNCYASAGATASKSADAGGLVGWNHGTVTDCYATGAATGDPAGGLVGGNSGAVSNCYAIGVATGAGAFGGAGGLVGSNGGKITNCYASGAATGTLDAGGLVGLNCGSIANCYATGAATAAGTFGDAGGLVGLNFDGGTVVNCYSTGRATADASSGEGNAGGLIGSNQDGPITNCYITNCYWDIQTSGHWYSDGGTGKYTVEMKRQATYEGWDFWTIWDIAPSVNDGYPHLRPLISIPEPTPTPMPTETPSGEKIQSVVLHFYREILDRDPSPGEADAWSVGYFEWLMAQDVDVRFVPSEMGRQFFLSQEYANRGRSDIGFITDCYRAFLYRDPSPDEIDGWAPVANRKEAMSIFANSQEFQDRVVGMFPNMAGDPTRNFVATMYLGLLDRLPDPGGLAFYADQFDAAADKRERAEQMGQEVSASDEYAEKRTTSALRAESLYRAYLGRYPNNGETQYWSGELDAARQTLATMITAFAGSQEFANRLAEYFGG